MTYKELAEWVSELNEEQKGQDVTVLLADSNEFMPVKTTGINTPDQDNFDVLDENHPYLMIRG